MTYSTLHTCVSTQFYCEINFLKLHLKVYWNPSWCFEWITCLIKLLLAAGCSICLCLHQTAFQLIEITAKTTKSSPNFNISFRADIISFTSQGRRFKLEFKLERILLQSSVWIKGLYCKLITLDSLTLNYYLNINN